METQIFWKWFCLTGNPVCGLAYRQRLEREPNGTE